MIRTSYNDIIIKIFFEGKEIQKVYKTGIQVFPEQQFSKFFWLKVFDEDDQKTYYYNCTQTSVTYTDETTESIKEIHYTTSVKQEDSPGENVTVYELLNDLILITGDEYSKNDFESFVDKTQSEVLSMTPTYQEKIITGKISGMNPTDYVNDDDFVEHDISQVDTVLNYYKLKLSDFSGSIGDYKYIMNWNKGYSKITKRCIAYLKITNNSEVDTKIQYIVYALTQLGQFVITDSEEDIMTIIKDNGENDIYKIKGLKNIIICYGGWNWSSGYTSEDVTAKKIYNLTIPGKKTYYVCCYWYSGWDVTADKSTWEWYSNAACFFYNKDVSMVSTGNFLNHKYISDSIQKTQIKKNKYKFAYALVKNDLNKKVYQTNCKYIISKEVLQSINVNNVLCIPQKSLGWQLLTNEEFLKYSPKNNNYEMVLTVSDVYSTGDEFWGLLDKSNDYDNDFRIFGYGSYIYFDPGSSRISFTANADESKTITFIINGKTNKFTSYKDSSLISGSEWDYSSDKYVGGFNKNYTGLYLNAFESESKLTDEKFYFYEFKIINLDTNEVVKRFVPSDNNKQLWECVDGKYIDPCRTVQDANLPTLIDNLKLDVETKDGLGDKIENWEII